MVRTAPPRAMGPARITAISVVSSDMTAATSATSNGASATFGMPWIATIIGYPAAVSVPLAFASMVLVSKLTPHQIPADVGRLLTRLHAPERLGVGKDREANLRPE